MDTQHPSAPARAQSRVAGNDHPHGRPRSGRSSGGLIHDHTRHTTRFTVVGNHLAQHPELSGLAIGLGVHIQSLPQHARVDIRTLTDRFPEGKARVAAALRELETHGYLRRERVRTPEGRIITRTISCNQPGRKADKDEAAEAEAGVDPDADADPVPPTPSRPLKKRTPRKPLPPVPQPAYPSPALLQQAADLLADLRHRDPSLLLSACDTHHLAPGVAAWLQRDVGPSAVRQALTSDLPPEGLRRPAAFLAHRLMAQLPPPPPFRAPESPPPVRHPHQTCDGCDRVFRAPEPGRCRDCRSACLEAA